MTGSMGIIVMLHILLLNVKALYDKVMFHNDSLTAAADVFIVIILFYKYEQVMGIYGQTLMQINSKKLEIENASIEGIYEALSDRFASVFMLDIHDRLFIAKMCFSQKKTWWSYENKYEQN